MVQPVEPAARARRAGQQRRARERPDRARPSATAVPASGALSAQPQRAASAAARGPRRAERRRSPRPRPGRGHLARTAREWPEASVAATIEPADVPTKLSTGLEVERRPRPRCRPGRPSSRPRPGRRRLPGPGRRGTQEGTWPSEASRVYVIAYGCLVSVIETMEAQIHIGPARARAARRDGPVAARPRGALGRQRAHAQPGRARRDQPDAGRRHRIAAGLELRLSQLLRLDEAGTVTRRARGRGPPRGHGRAPRGDPHGAAARPARELSRHVLAPGASTGGAGDPPMHEAGSRETALVERARSSSSSTASATTWDGRLRHLRRRPRPPLREPRRGGGSPAGRRVGGAPTLDEPARCSTRSGTPTWSPPNLLYIDLHLVHEVTSPQAFEALRLAGRKVRRPDLTLATADHNVPTDGDAGRRRSATSSAADRDARRNCAEFGITLYDARLRAPGHRPRHRPGAGPHPAGHDDRLRRQPHGDARRASARWPSASARARSSTCWPRRRSSSASPRRCGSASTASSARRHGQGPDPGDHRPDRRRRRRPATSSSTPAPADRRLSMEGRMTVCNMSIEAGARAGMIAPDDTTFASGRRHAPRAPTDRRRGYWRTLPHRRRREVRPRGRRVDAADAQPAGHLGHEPRPGRRSRRVPTRQSFREPAAARREERALTLHGPRARHADPGHRARPRVHRLVHQRAHRRPARRRRGRRRASRSPATCARWSCPARPGEAPGRGRGARRGLPRRRLRLARARAARCAWA